MGGGGGLIIDGIHQEFSRYILSFIFLYAPFTNLEALLVREVEELELQLRSIIWNAASTSDATWTLNHAE
jgi:hypothetical protein